MTGLASDQETIERTAGVSVIMPTYNQGCFIRGAVNSLWGQTFKNWELVIIDDGCTDETQTLIADLMEHPQVRYIRHDKNRGLGTSLNKGVDAAYYDYIAYLPSDDLYYANHLETLFRALTGESAVLAFSGVLYNQIETITQSQGNTATGNINGAQLQLVQVMHKKVAARWTERVELVTNNLDLMYWNRLQKIGHFIPTGIVSCEWVHHENQHSTILNEFRGGGLYRYKQYYDVHEPVCYSNSGNYIDERAFTDRLCFQAHDYDKETLKILLVGELSFNPERVLAFEERGHQLYGLWIKANSFFSAVGPFPFGSIETLSNENYVDEINRVRPDIIYGLLNVHAINLAFEVRSMFPDIPFVWHFKESTTYSKQLGVWEKLIGLYRRADGCIYLNAEAKMWYHQYLDTDASPCLLLDGDLPRGQWFTNEISPLLSDVDGEVHTVISGRPYGFNPEDIGVLARRNVHIHFYGNFQQQLWREWIERSNRLAKGFLHIHPSCPAPNWVKEFSQYDAGWLHVYQAANQGEFVRVTWNELNYAARIPTLAAAGLPMIQKNNHGQISATQSLLERMNTGIFFDTYDDLADQLYNWENLSALRDHVWCNRMQLTFDYHVDTVIGFFKTVIKQKKAK